jgi:hypothetical protein
MASTPALNPPPAGPENALGKGDLAVLLLSAVYLALNLFTFRGPFLLGGDQVFFWMNAQRMLEGQRIYQDFFQFTPPGANLVYLALFRLFGPQVWVANLVVLLLGVALAWVCFRLAMSLVRPSLAALVPAVFLVFFYGKLLNATHHWFSVLAVLLAALVFLTSKPPARAVLAGILLGSASFFTLTRGPLALLALGACCAWETRRAGGWWRNFGRELALLAAGFALAWLALESPFLHAVGGRQLWYFQVSYVVHYMVRGWTAPAFGLPEALTWRRLPFVAPYLAVYLLLPAVYAVTLGKHWRAPDGASAGKARPAVLLALLGVALLAEVAGSPNWLRVFCVAAPAVVLLAGLSAAALNRPGARKVAWVALAVLAAVQISVRHRRQPALAELPAGRVATTPASAEKLSWLARRTSPGQQLFQPAWPGVYLPLQLRNPVFLDVLETGDQTRPAYVRLAVDRLEAQQVRYILWSPRLNPQFSGEPPATYHLSPFLDFLASRYRPVRTFADGDELWELR